MLHEPAPQEQGPDHAAGYKSRLGIRMFVIYALIYGGFVAINLIDVTIMEKQIFAGLNLAIVYGFGLIVTALALALVYNHLCTKKEAELNSKSTTSSQKSGVPETNNKEGK